MKTTLSPARWLWRFVGLRRARYAIGQHDLACADLGIHTGPDDPGATLHEAVQDLKQERDVLREALENAQSFIQAVGTEDPDDIEPMADIERLSGKITAALHYKKWLTDEEPNAEMCRRAERK